MSVAYKPVDAKLGISSPGAVPPAATTWKASTVYAAGAFVVNGGFAFYTAAGGTSAASHGPTPTMLTDNTVTWVLVAPVLPFNAQDAAPAVELGTVALGCDPTYGIGEFIYVAFTGTVRAGDFVIVDRYNKTAAQTPAAAPGAGRVSVVGLSMGEQVNGTYGWVMLRGVHDNANGAAGGTVGLVLYGSATAGRAGTGAVANYILDGAVLRNAGVAGCVHVELYWPVCSGR